MKPRTSKLTPKATGMTLRGRKRGTHTVPDAQRGGVEDAPDVVKALLLYGTDKMYSLPPLPAGKQHYTLGSASGHDISIPSPYVSAEHCWLVPTGKALQVVDRASKNGTAFEGKQRKTFELEPGKTFFVGARSHQLLALNDQMRAHYPALAAILGYEDEHVIPGDTPTPKAVAQNIANGLGVEVEAPSDLIWIHKDGTIVIGPDDTSNTGRWVTFRPLRKQQEATSSPPAEAPHPPLEAMSAPARTAPELSVRTDSGDAAAGGRQDRRSRENRLKDKNRELRKDEHDEDSDEATATPEPEARAVPVGMKPEQFKRFADALHAGFAELDIHDVVAVVQGSGATNRSYKHGASFDEARVSDYDIALVSPTLVRRAEDFHIKLSGPLSEQDISMLGFKAILIHLRQMTERPVNFKLMRGTDLPEGIRVP